MLNRPDRTDRRTLLRLSGAGLLAPFASASPALSLTPSGPEIRPSPLFDVRQLGATGDGRTVDTPVINRAIRAIADAGGGTLMFPAGIYLCFTLHLRSRVDLYLAHGCTLLAADSPRPSEATGYNGGVYDPAEPNTPWEPFQDFGHNHWHNSLLVGDNISDVAITGPGLIHGAGLSHGGALNDHRGPYPNFKAEQPGVGNKAIALKNCHNILLRDFAILKGGHFALLATGVDNLTIDNLTIDTDRDGLDLDCCRNVRVSNCTVNSPWDDAICPKSSFALGYARSTDNVTISNNFVTGSYQLGTVLAGTWKTFGPQDHVPRNGRIKCGTESNGGFRNITVTGNVIEGCKGIALETSDGALVEDIVISGNTLRDIVDAPLFLRLNRRNRGPKDSMRPGTLRRILISDLVSYNSNASTSSLLSGIPSNAIEDVKISNCFFDHRGLPAERLANWGGERAPMPDWRTLQVPELEDAYPELLQFGPTPCHGFFLRHLRHLEMSHIEIRPSNPDPRPALLLEDVDRADFFAITAPAQPNFRLLNVRDLRILWSRAAQDITLASVASQTL